jgi:hypothetical protein
MFLELGADEKSNYQFYQAEALLIWRDIASLTRIAFPQHPYYCTDGFVHL